MTELVLHRRFTHSLDRVWRACSEADELAQWMPVSKDHPVESDPPRLIAWDSNGHYVRIELAADGDGTLMTFTHRFDGVPDPFAAGWELYLGRLGLLLEGQPIGEQEIHDERHFELADGPELRLVRHFACSVERLWHAITAEPEHWFPGAMETVETDPPRRLVARWHGDTLRFELSADGPVAAMRFSHAFAERDTAARSAAGWDRCFARLDGLLSGAPVDDRAALVLWPHVHEGYAAEFGVDPEIGRGAYAEHPAT